MVNDLDLNLLTALDALLQERHVTRAARKVALSEPAMSRALQRLRLTFHDELLVRIGREYYLTELAERLQEPVHEILDRIADTVVIRPSFDPATDTREFTVATSDYSAYLVLRPLAKLLAQISPGTSLNIVPLDADSLHELTAARLELVLTRQPEDYGLPWEVLFDDQWCCAVSASHPDIGDTISKEQYLAQRHLLFTYNQAITRAGLKLGESLREPIAMTTESLVPFFLTGTSMVAMMPERTGREMSKLVDIRLLPAPFDTPPIRLRMFWHPRSHNDPAHSWLRERIREICVDI